MFKITLNELRRDKIALILLFIWFVFNNIYTIINTRFILFVTDAFIRFREYRKASSYNSNNFYNSSYSS